MKSLALLTCFTNQFDCLASEQFVHYSKFDLVKLIGIVVKSVFIAGLFNPSQHHRTITQPLKIHFKNIKWYLEWSVNGSARSRNLGNDLFDSLKSSKDTLVDNSWENPPIQRRFFHVFLVVRKERCQRLGEKCLTKSPRPRCSSDLLSPRGGLVLRLPPIISFLSPSAVESAPIHH